MLSLPPTPVKGDVRAAASRREHAVLVIDGAGDHVAARLAVLSNITLCGPTQQN